jgi:hypothetical protein
MPPGALPNVFENRSQPLATPRIFLVRVLNSFLMTIVVIGCSLGIGTLGYHFFGTLPWTDALLNAAMILTGMGPVDPMKSTGGKLFATFYCLFSGIVFLSLTAIILAPIYHRFMHQFHLDEEEDVQQDHAAS